jgi:hypothetical protein
MEYQTLVIDFARRTLKNLDFIEENLGKPGAEVYEVTQLINSLLGLLVFPQQRFYTSIPAIPLHELVQQGWPALETLQGQPPCDNLKDLFRYLRNGIAHFNVEFTSDSNAQIAGIHIWNVDMRNASSRNRWDIQLSLKDLRAITRKFIELLEATPHPGYQNRIDG